MATDSPVVAAGEAYATTDGPAVAAGEAYATTDSPAVAADEAYEVPDEAHAVPSRRVRCAPMPSTRAILALFASLLLAACMLPATSGGSVPADTAIGQALATAEGIIDTAQKVAGSR